WGPSSNMGRTWRGARAPCTSSTTAIPGSSTPAPSSTPRWGWRSPPPLPTSSSGRASVTASEIRHGPTALPRHRRLHHGRQGPPDRRERDGAGERHHAPHPLDPEAAVVRAGPARVVDGDRG